MKTRRCGRWQGVDALATALSFYIDARKPLPAVSKARLWQQTVRPSALAGAKLGVYPAMPSRGHQEGRVGAARCPGWHKPQVDRLFDLRHASRFDQIEAAARVLGRRMDVRVG